MTADPTSDYSACTTWCCRGEYWYLLDVYRARLDYGALKDRVVRMNKDWRADQVIIEYAQSGMILWRELRQERAMSAKANAFEPKDDKLVRFETQIARLETGKFLVPAQAPWLAEFCQECLATWSTALRSSSSISLLDAVDPCCAPASDRRENSMAAVPVPVDFGSVLEMARQAMYRLNP